MLAADPLEAARWGKKAIELARELEDRETQMHALNNVGTALYMAGDVAEGRVRLTQSLDLALADDAHEHAARAYTNLGASAVDNRSFAEADRHLQAGIAYCTDRDLDTWRLYMTASLARSRAEQGQYAAADRHLADILRHAQLSPITRICALAVAGGLAARRGRGGAIALDDALPIAVHTGELQRLTPVAAARAEAAWIAGRISDVAAEIDRAWGTAVRHPQRWDLGELSWWLRVSGDDRQIPAPVAEPFALMLADDHRAAAQEWQALGCPLWAAYALAFSPQMRDAQECLDILDRLGAAAVRHAVLRDRHARL
jgi:predicted negative regulator of RcsB-dependent stress response